MSKQKLTQVARKGDCVKLALELPYKPKLIIADPPYNQGMPYEAYKDNKSYDQYMKWTKEWMWAASKAVDKHGSIAVFAPDEWVTEIDMLARHNLKLHRQRWIVWAFTFGQKAQKSFTRSHCHILWFSKAKTKYTFNLDAVKVPSARQLVYKDKRAAAGGKPPDDTWMLLKDQMEPYMTPDRDVWMVSRICGNFKERKAHSPNQIPLPIMDRLVKTLSNPGDRVLDLFCGTGSSGIVCKSLGRNWEGLDVSATCVEEANKQLS